MLTIMSLCSLSAMGVPTLHVHPDPLVLTVLVGHADAGFVLEPVHVVWAHRIKIVHH